MKRMFCTGLGVAAVALAMGVGNCAGAVPAPTPTLWNFLGIPQTFHKIRDTLSNRSGNRPGAERKDPIKRIADPANLESDNPAIKTAAKIKADQDLAPQKVKAIRFLATVGCDCYEEVGGALAAALEDCTEEVRYEAAVALCKTAGNACCHCEKGCCNAKIMTKLNDMASGQDEKGCYKESSPRVRAAAELALNACRQKVGATEPTPTPVPKRGKEVPTNEPGAAPPSELQPVPVEPPKPGPTTQKSENEPSVTLRILTPSDDRPDDSAVRPAAAEEPSAEK
jgi:hypothetical protein